MAWSDVAPSTTCRDVLRADPYSPLAQHGWHAHPRMRRRREARPRTLELHTDSRFSSQRVYTAQHRRCDGSQSRHDVRLDPHDQAGDGSWNLEVRRCESDARRFVGSAVDNRMHVWPHGTVCAVDMARCGAGGGTTAGVMLQVTERGGTTVFACTQTNRYAVLMCGVVRISRDRFRHLEMGDHAVMYRRKSSPRHMDDVQPRLRHASERHGPSINGNIRGMSCLPAALMPHFIVHNSRVVPLVVLAQPVCKANVFSFCSCKRESPCSSIVRWRASLRRRIRGWACRPCCARGL